MSLEILLTQYSHKKIIYVLNDEEVYHVQKNTTLEVRNIFAWHMYNTTTFNYFLVVTTFLKQNNYDFNLQLNEINIHYDPEAILLLFPSYIRYNFIEEYAKHDACIALENILLSGTVTVCDNEYVEARYIENLYESNIGTNNQSLIKILQTINSNYEQSIVVQNIQNTMKGEFWINVAKYIFLLFNNHKELNALLAYSFIKYEYQQYILLSNIMLDKALRKLFLKYQSNINIDQKYTFESILEYQQNCVKELCNPDCEFEFINDLKQYYHYIVTPKEYIKIITYILNNHVSIKHSNSDQCQIIPLKYISIYNNVHKIHLAGFSASDSIICLSNQTQYTCSYSNHYKYTEYNISNIVLNLVPIYEHGSIGKHIINHYKESCPDIKYRPKTIAANHITKLNTNPYAYFIECLLGFKVGNFELCHWTGVYLHKILEEASLLWSDIKSESDLHNILHSLVNASHFSGLIEIQLKKKLNTMSTYLWQTICKATKITSEIEGLYPVIINGVKYTLHTRADLLYFADNKIGILDYKTGQIPLIKNLINGQAPQLSLLLLVLLNEGFFDGYSKFEQLADCGFISPDGIKVIEETEILYKNAYEGVRKVLSHFLTKKTPFPAINTNSNDIYRSLMRDYSY